jgi:endonuclease/exonuclease/phosphatase family metal-dependent hydrolase
MSGIVSGCDRRCGTTVSGMKRGIIRTIIIALTLLIALLRGCTACGSCAASVFSARRVATFNIRKFGQEPKDMARVADVLWKARADVVALQEVMKVEAAEDLARRLSTGARRFRVALSNCGGKSGMRVGFLYDEGRVTLRETREYPDLEPDGKGSCNDGDKAALLGAFDAGGRAFQLLAIHLAAGSEPEKLARRKEQWARALLIATMAGKKGPVAILGDTNSTGFLDDRHGERTFIVETARDAKLTLATKDLGCSEYYGPVDALRPSLLDHVLATPGLVKDGSAEVHGFCAELGCKPQSRAPQDFLNVSDHCPVTFDLADVRPSMHDPDSMSDESDDEERSAR